MNNYFGKTTYLLLFSLLITACNIGSSDDDKTPPIIDIQLPQNGDTIFLDYKYNTVSYFSDDESLSSYSISIYSTKSSVGRQDSLYAYYQKTVSDIFGEKEVSSSTEITLRPNQQKDTVGVSIILPVIPGDYKFKVKCMDKAGNMDSLIHDIKVVYLEK